MCQYFFFASLSDPFHFKCILFIRLPGFSCSLLCCCCLYISVRVFVADKC